MTQPTVHYMIIHTYNTMHVSENNSLQHKKVGIECVFHWFLLFSYINPLTPVNEMFADFRETSSTCFSWYAEFRTVRIFKISLAVPNLCEIFVFLGFLTVHAYLKRYLYENYTV